jgi:RNA polymerase sigma-70 factor (ECF subfamily)
MIGPSRKSVTFLVRPALSHVEADSPSLSDVSSSSQAFDFERVFLTQFPHIARIIASIVRNPARAEDVTVEVFWKLWRHPKAHGSNAAGWLYRTAIRMSLDELRRQSRREKYERLFSTYQANPNPEQLYFENQTQCRVNQVLAALKPRHAELLLLRSEGLTYEEIARHLGLNASSIGSLLARAQNAFRREYTKRYGCE